VEIMSETARRIDELQTELRDLRDRMIPMFEVVAEDWAHRTEPGYPVVFDNVETNGYFGVTLDPGYSLFVMIDRGGIVAQLNVIAWRTDVRSAANYEKFTSLPAGGMKTLSAKMTDNQLRNLISELLSHWNVQPLVIRVTDS
jgi:hypothetical protein